MTLHNIFLVLAGLATFTSIVSAGIIPRTNDYLNFTVKCGMLNMFFSGLPAFHPLVIAQGFNSTLVDAALRKDAADIIKAGYNLKLVLMGPEIPISILKDQVQDKGYDGVGVGYGVRGSNSLDLTVRLEDIVKTYRNTNPNARMIFNHSPNTTLEAIKRNFPLSTDCSNSPGQNLGFVTVCNICGNNPQRGRRRELVADLKRS